jgi:hypothetical protein
MKPPMDREKERLAYPHEIADVIGLSWIQISALKSKGCEFVGQKTTILWVREYLKVQAQMQATARVGPS